MDRERIDDLCEKGILVLVLGILIFTPVALGGVLVWQVLVLQGLTALAALLWAVRLWTAKRPAVLWPPICWGVVAFVAYAVARYLGAENEYVSRLELIRVVIYALLFFIALNNLHRQETTHLVALTLVFLGMAIAGCAVWQFLTKSERVWGLLSVYRGRAGGTFYNPNSLAAFLVLLAPLGFCYVLVGRLSHMMKIVVGYASVVMIAGVAVTVSRGGMLALAAALLVLCGVLLFQRNFRIQALALLAVLGVAGVILVPKLQSVRTRFEDLSSPTKRAEDLRLSIWKGAARMWRDHLWTGVGPGQFDNYFPEYRPMEVQAHPEQAHNDYLNTLAEYGVAGAALVVATWGLLFWGICKTWKHVRAAPDDFARKKSSKFALMLGTTVGLLGVLIHSFVDFPLHVPGVAVTAVVLMALLSSQWRFATERYWFGAGGVAKWAATAVLAGGIVYLGWTGWRGARECEHLARASRCPNYSNARIAELKLAWEIEPRNEATTSAIAECYRVKSWNGGVDYVNQAKQAMEWFQRGMKLNPVDSFNWIGYGMCLDWIGPGEAQEDPEKYYGRAMLVDPNGHYPAAMMGWHYVQTGDYAAARTWFERSLWLQREDNDIPVKYLPIVERRLADAAEGR